MAEFIHPSTALPASARVLVIGAGTMGAGIAEVAARAGHPVTLRDTQVEALQRARGQITQSLDKRLARGQIDAATHRATLARVATATDTLVPPDTGLVIEVIVEQLEAKVSVLQAVEAQVGAGVILATNTSSISVTALAGRLQRPERVVGMHFFNPATVLPLVEVVSGAATDPAVAQGITATARAWGKVPVNCRSTPGFIVNRVARPFYAEALRLLQVRAAAPHALDAVMREAGGFRMGPCELMDMIGHDVNFAVTRSVWEGFFQDPRYQPSQVQQELVHAGWLGRKRGRGFYSHHDDAPRPVVPDDGAGRPAPDEVRVAGHLGTAEPWRGLWATGRDWRFHASEVGEGVARVDGLVLACTDGRSAQAWAEALGEPVVLMDLVRDPALCSRVVLAPSPGVAARQLERVAGLFHRLGKRVTVWPDVPGLLVMRTVAMLVNEAADALDQGLASAEDIDLAMMQGVNYPVGPLAWGRSLGWAQVARVLDHLAAAHGDGHYRTSPWIRRQAGLATEQTPQEAACLMA